MKTRIVLIGVVLLGWAVSAQATPITYNVANDFSATTNGGSNAWSYGYYTGSNAEMDTFAASTTPNHISSGLGAGLDVWAYSSGWSDPSISHNGTGSTITVPEWGTVTWAPNAFVLVPGAVSTNGMVAVARWTAPSAGTIDINGVFKSVQEVNSHCLVVVNQKIGGVIANVWGDMCSYTGTGYTASGLAVAAGDKLDFVVQQWPAGGGGWNGGKPTQLDATIALTPIPEPSTMLLSVTGLLGLVAYVWRKRG
jgi:hypothetical protein